MTAASSSHSSSPLPYSARMHVAGGSHTAELRAWVSGLLFLASFDRLVQLADLPLPPAGAAASCPRSTGCRSKCDQRSCMQYGFWPRLISGTATSSTSSLLPLGDMCGDSVYIHQNHISSLISLK